MSLLNRTWKNLMTAGITVGISIANAQTPDERPHAPEPERQIETPEEIRKNTPAEEDARNQDAPKTLWKSIGKIAIKGSTSSSYMDTGLEAKGGAFIEREPDLSFPIGIKAGFRVSSGRHTLGHKVSGAQEDHRLTSFGFRGNTFLGGIAIPFSKNPKGPYLTLGRFDGYMGYENCDDNKGWFLGSIIDKDFPGHHTGGYIHYPINDQLLLRTYLVTGWNETFNDDNKDLSYGASLRYAPDKKLILGVAYYGGREGSTKNSSKPHEHPKYGKIEFWNPGSTRVDLGSAYIQYALDDKWTYALAGHYGKAKAPNESKWYGGGIFVYYQYDKQWQLGGSFETARDKGGFLTKKPELFAAPFNMSMVSGSTLALAAKTSTTKHSNIKGEVRYSWANIPMFDDKKSRWNINLVQTYVF